MWRCLLAVVLVGSTGVSTQSEFDPYTGPRPITVLIQTNPWLMVVGSDTPLIAIYEDGQVIYVRKYVDDSSTYVHKQLSESELLAVKGELNTLTDNREWKREYDLAPDIDDLPETRIYVNLDGKEHVAKIYGLIGAKSGEPVPEIAHRPIRVDLLPDGIVQLRKYLSQLDYADAKKWTPQYIEVMIWPWENASDTLAHWPKEWPSLDSPEAVAKGDSYSIFLSGDKIPDLRAFLATRQNCGAIEIGGRKWAVEWRYAFPSEPVWREAFRTEQQLDETAPTE